MPRASRNRLFLVGDQKGFTLIELIVVIIVIAALLAIAVPSYLAMRNRAEDPAAKANVRASVPALEAYFADNGTYVGASYAVLQASYDAGLAPITLSNLSAASYCVQATVGSKTYRKNGPAGQIVAGAC